MNLKKFVTLFLESEVEVYSMCFNVQINVDIYNQIIEDILGR
jgi:hypothetical protein